MPTGIELNGFRLILSRERAKSAGYIVKKFISLDCQFQHFSILSLMFDKFHLKF